MNPCAPEGLTVPAPLVADSCYFCYIPGVYSIKVTSNERGKGDGIVTMLHNGRFRNDVKIVNYGRLTFLLSEERQNNKNGSVLSHGL